MNRGYRYMTVMLLLFVPLVTGFAGEIGVETTVRSAQEWRGVKTGDSPVFQPRFFYAGELLYLEVWGSMDLTDDQDMQFEFNETRYTVGLEHMLNGSMISAGIVKYQYSVAGMEDTTELYAGISFDCVLNPSVIVYRDVDAYEGTYAQFSISHTLPLQWNRTDGVELFAILGYGDASYKSDRFGHGMGGTGDGPGGPGSGEQQDLSAGLAQYAIGAELPIRLGKGELRFSCTYTDFADSNLHSPMFPEEDGQLILGISYTRWFSLSR